MIQKKALATQIIEQHIPLLEIIHNISLKNKVILKARIPKSVSKGLKACNMWHGDKYLMGCFDEHHQLIYIFYKNIYSQSLFEEDDLSNEDFIAAAEYILVHTLAHESRHFWQYVNNFSSKDWEEDAEDFAENYINGEYN